MDWEKLKAGVSQVIKTNGNKEITGAVLQSTLLTTISNIGGGRTFAGFAAPTTDPGTPDGNVMWFATEEGTYQYFDNLALSGRYLFIVYNTATGWQYNAVDIGANLYLAAQGSAIQHYANASDIPLATAASGWYLTDIGSSAQHVRGITIIYNGIIVNDIDVKDNSVYITTTDGHFWYAPANTSAWVDLGAIAGVPGKDGEPGKDGADGKDAEYYTLTPITESLLLDASGTVVGTLNYNVYHVKGATRTQVTLSDTNYWRWQIAGSSTWNNVKKAGGASVTWNSKTNSAGYVTVELIISGETVDSRVVNSTPGNETINALVFQGGQIVAGVSAMDEELGEVKTSQVKLTADMAEMSTTMGEVSAKVATSVQYDSATGKVTSNITLSADQIELEGEVSANGEFAIDKYGNVKTGTALSPSAGATSYIVEDKSNIVFEDNITIQLPNDPEYIGRRVLVLAQPRHNSAGAVLKPGTSTPITVITQTGKCTIQAARVLNNWIYGYTNGGNIYASANDTSDAEAVKSALDGLQFFGGNVVVESGGNFVLPTTLEVQCGYIELLGIPYAVNNMYAAKSPVKGGNKYAVHMTRSDDGLIDDTDTANGIINVTATTESDSPTYGQPGSPWQEVTQLCQWVVINVNAQVFGKS